MGNKRFKRKFEIEEIKTALFFSIICWIISLLSGIFLNSIYAIGWLLFWLILFRIIHVRFYYEEVSQN